MTDPVGDDDTWGDPQLLLANERTFLAYVRTALALQAAGLATLQFLTGTRPVVRFGLGMALVLVGSFAGIAGWARYRESDRRLRTGRPLRRLHATAFLAVAVATVPLVAAVLVALI